MDLGDSFLTLQSKQYSVIASEKCIQKPPFSACLQLEKGGKCLSYLRATKFCRLTGLFQHFTYLENLASTAQSSQSLVIPELQLSEVLDGADHLRGVAVLVVVPGHDLLTGPKVACQLTFLHFWEVQCWCHFLHSLPYLSPNSLQDCIHSLSYLKSWFQAILWFRKRKPL